MSAAAEMDAPEAAPFVSAPTVVATTGIEFSPSLANIAKALILAQGNMSEIRKSSTNPHFRSKYADLPTCVDAVQPALQGAGIAFLQAATSNADASVVFVETMFLHESGEWVRSRLGLRPVKNDPQGAGSAITYGRRYTLLAMCGVAPEEDDDGNAASRRPRQQHADPPARAERPVPAPVSDETPPARTEQPAAGNERQNAAKERVLSTISRGFAALHVASERETEELIERATARRIPADSWATALEPEEHFALRDFLIAEFKSRQVHQGDAVCEVCTAQPGEPHLSDGEMPCENDQSEAAFKWRVDHRARERGVTDDEQELPL